MSCTKPKWVLATKTVFTALAVMSMPETALAGKCDASGGLRYLGMTSDKSKSVWLSATSPGSFELEAAKGSKTVDQWTKSKKGLRLSLSPDVSNGNGGTHKLLDVGGSKPCLLDSQNQKGGFIFPPITRPPVWIRPPTEVTPITPELPPIGTLSPPTLVTPPIGTLPPTGVMPTLPTLPGGGVKPPTGLTPTLPGGVTPPIGTLPPPTGLMPTLPGGVTPPIGTLPPPTGITPTEPSVRTPANAEAMQLVNTTIPIMPCATAPRDESGALSGTQPLDCLGITPVETSNEDVGSVPITAGREFGVETLWNVWTDNRYLDTSDQRNGLDFNASGSNFTIGADRRLSDDLIAGVSLLAQYGKSDSFNKTVKSDSDGFVIGPYIGYQFSRNWVIDASLGYGRTENNRQISVLEGDFTTQSYSVSLIANGQYPLGEAFVRPRVSFYYAHTRADSYDMEGIIFQTPITLYIPKSSFNFGIAETSVEVNRTFITSSGTPIMPYVELTAQYAFERQNDGDILTGNLLLESTNPWNGALRGGARAMVNRSTNVEASAGYLSLGQNGLDIWEFKLFLSHSF